MSFRILDLPSEIRNIITKLVCVLPKPIYLYRSNDKRLQDLKYPTEDLPFILQSDERFTGALSYIQANRQLRYEAWTLFYSSNIFEIRDTICCCSDTFFFPLTQNVKNLMTKFTMHWLEGDIELCRCGEHYEEDGAWGYTCDVGKTLENYFPNMSELRVIFYAHDHERVSEPAQFENLIDDTAYCAIKAENPPSSLIRTLTIDDSASASALATPSSSTTPTSTPTYTCTQNNLWHNLLMSKHHDHVHTRSEVAARIEMWLEREASRDGKWDMDNLDRWLLPTRKLRVEWRGACPLMDVGAWEEGLERFLGRVERWREAGVGG